MTSAVYIPGQGVLSSDDYLLGCSSEVHDPPPPLADGPDEDFGTLIKTLSWLQELPLRNDQMDRYINNIIDHEVDWDTDVEKARCSREALDLLLEKLQVYVAADRQVFENVLSPPQKAVSSGQLSSTGSSDFDIHDMCDDRAAPKGDEGVEPAVEGRILGQNAAGNAKSANAPVTSAPATSPSVPAPVPLQNNLGMLQMQQMMLQQAYVMMMMQNQRNGNGVDNTLPVNDSLTGAANKFPNTLSGSPQTPSQTGQAKWNSSAPVVPASASSTRKKRTGKGSVGSNRYPSDVQAEHAMRQFYEKHKTAAVIPVSQVPGEGVEESTSGRRRRGKVL